MSPHLMPIDIWLSSIDKALRTLSGANVATRPCPTPMTPAAALDERERSLSGALMRVNHVGEVCAQALYQGQCLVTSDAALRTQFADAAREETDHLAWTQQRLRELGGRPSLLNPIWYAGALCIGMLAGRTSDRLSLAFVVETERQVERHLDSHLQRLPVGDTPSRAIVVQMQADELGHAAKALQAGASELPWTARALMRIAAKVMTTTAHYI
jgi:ubiquinone biosynthesis monooxygenase Coq7